jgi:hypothetical protein
MDLIHPESKGPVLNAYEVKILETISVGRVKTGGCELASAFKITIWL